VSAPAALRPLADSGVLIEFERRLDAEINARARAVAARLAAVPGVVETVPALCSTLIVFDPLTTDVPRLLEAAEAAALSARPASPGSSRRFEVPVVYGGAAGPDLEEVAAHCRLTPSQVIAEHAGAEYTVYMLGFTPGYPYLGVLPEALRLRRLDTPRLRVPAGSVAIAGALTGIYPMDSPGGWRLIGRTPLALYDPRAAHPVLLRPGDRVRFAPAAGATRSAAPPIPPAPPPARPVLEIRSGGLHTTVQDLGRPGFRALGIPASGAMDALALEVANLAVGNPRTAAALEFATPGPVARVLEDSSAALAGADLSATLDGEEIEPARAFRLRPGQVLRFGAPRRGVWGYLAVRGGIDVPAVLGSASSFVPGALGGYHGRRLRDGDIVGRGPDRPAVAVPGLTVPLPGDEVTLRVIVGPHDDWLTADSRARLLAEPFVVTVHTDRAGARLEGSPLTHASAEEFLSDGLLPGAVQVPSGGRPIVILPDGPTTGGYPKAAAVIGADLRLLAQSRPGTRLRFRAVSMDEAVEAAHAQRAALDAR